MQILTVISGCRRDVDEICALLGYYSASSGNPLPTFRDNVSVQSSRAKKSSSWNSWPLKMGPIRCPEASVKDYHSTRRNLPEEHRYMEMLLEDLANRKICAKFFPHRRIDERVEHSHNFRIPIQTCETSQQFLNFVVTGRIFNFTGVCSCSSEGEVVWVRPVWCTGSCPVRGVVSKAFTGSHVFACSWGAIR
jgi:hypothetical protein